VSKEEEVRKKDRNKTTAVELNDGSSQGKGGRALYVDT
jgi:hypothetical protein